MRGPKGLNEGLPAPLGGLRSARPWLRVLLHRKGTSIMSQTASKPAVHLVSKGRDSRPNHHLTNNNGTWWCQITIHQGPFSRRLRFSLGTGELERARALRDRVFANLTSGVRAA